MTQVAEHIPRLASQTIVQIEIVNGVIHVFPQRAGETVVFCCDPKKTPPPALPREVRWVVTGLGADQYLRIEPKDPASRMFNPPMPRIPRDCNTVASGPPCRRHGTGVEETWRYSIVVYGANDVPMCSKDPGIIIKDWP
jgi:hypothetical protein